MADTALDARLAGKRIGLLTAAASRLGGGVFEAVAVQAAMIRAVGGEVVVFALDDIHAREDAARLAPSSVTTAKVVGPGQVGFAPDLAERMIAADLDLLHLHGIWMYPSRAATVWARRTGRPYVVSPHGMLDPWITARGRWKKALARVGYERTSWRAAARLHALTRRESEDIARESCRHDSLVIPNAGPVPGVLDLAERANEVLFLGRIHPKKNLVALIDAWELAARRGKLPGDARLTIAGWGDPADVAAFEVRMQTAHPTITFIGPCFGAAKAQRLAQARYMILPSHSEGLPMAVLEAWAAGMPTLMTAECNLPDGYDAGAALDCGFTPDAIAACLTKAIAMPHQQWQAMALAAHGLASTGFSPDAITRRWADAYTALIDQNAEKRA